MQSDPIIHPCDYCADDILLSEILSAKKRNQDGYFCDTCEYKHYFDPNQKRPTYTLYLEEKATTEQPVASKPRVPLKQKPKKRLSPLRYPGGKSKLIDYILTQLDPDQLRMVISPFTGGGSVELALLESGLTKHLVLNDKDPDVYNFWNVSLNQTDELIQLIQTRPLTVSLYETAHQYMTDKKPFNGSNIEKAFLFLINNRCSFSGIYNAGRMGGKKGSLGDLSARYNPNTLVKQLTRLNKLNNDPSTKIEVRNDSYENIIEEYAWLGNNTFFIDPPYITEQAKSIYKHAFDDTEHHHLFAILNEFWHSFPNSDFLVFYDNHTRINEFPIPNDVKIINRRYSISNK